MTSSKPTTPAAAAAASGRLKRNGRLAGATADSNKRDTFSSQHADVTVAIIEKTAHVQIRVSISFWRGQPKIHVREYHPGVLADDWWPSKIGVALNVAQLPALSEAVSKVIDELRQRGLMDGADV